MSSSTSTFDTSGIFKPENILEVIKIDKNYCAITFSEANGLVAIDLSENSEAGKTFSNIHIIKMKNNRFLITAEGRTVYSAAQIKDKIIQSKNKATPIQIIKYYGISSKDYFFHKPSGSSETIIIFRNQKLVSTRFSKIKIDCSNYTIISES